MLGPGNPGWRTDDSARTKANSVQASGLPSHVNARLTVIFRYEVIMHESLCTVHECTLVPRTRTKL